MDRKTVTLHDLRTRVEAQKRHIHTKYLQHLDAQLPLQRYAGLVATLLMARCDSMLLYRHLPQTTLHSRSESENKLRDILLTAALTTLEIGATLDTLPSLSSWAWYSTTYQQYHAVLLLLTELYRTPDLARKDRMMTIIDHIFGHCYGVGARERCSDLLWTVKENLEAFYVMKGVNKRKAVLHQPPFRPMRQASTTTASDLGISSIQPNQLQTPMDSLDFESILSGLASGNSTEGFEDFFTGVPNQDPGAIFVPVDTGVQQVQNTEWIDGNNANAVNANSTTSPNSGLQQWVSS